MSVLNRVSLFLSKYGSVEQVLACPAARSEMSAIASALAIDTNVSCNGCVMGKYLHFQSLVGDSMQVASPNVDKKTVKKMSENTQALEGHQGKRYWLPEGKKIMPFNTGTYYDNSTITDELVEKFDKLNPGFKNAFIDTWETKMPGSEKRGLTQPDHTPHLESEDSKSEKKVDPKKHKKKMPKREEGDETINYQQKDPERFNSYDEGFNKEELHARYTELTGNGLPVRIGKRELINEIMREEDALQKLNEQ